MYPPSPTPILNLWRINMSNIRGVNTVDGIPEYRYFAGGECADALQERLRAHP